MKPRTRSTARAGLAVTITIAIAVVVALGPSGCTSDRVDPPDDEDLLTGEEPTASVDSAAAWAQRAREGWAPGDAASSRDAARLARDAFAATWVAAVDDRREAGEAIRRAERLPVQPGAASPAPEAVLERLSAIGLAAEITVAEGPMPLWQVTVSDPVGSAEARTELLAWPGDGTAPGMPGVQSLPLGAPSRTARGPSAVGSLVTFKRADGFGAATAWARPRGRAGVEVAVLGKRTGRSAEKAWTVEASQVLPLTVDSLGFDRGASAQATPALLARGAGTPDPFFDECGACPHIHRVLRYGYGPDGWTKLEEYFQPSPYAAFVAFVHALVEGAEESALTHAAGPEVLELAVSLGVDRRPPPRWRAVPGTHADDLSQTFRRAGQEAIEVTFARQGTRWVVAGLRPTVAIIE